MGRFVSPRATRGWLLATVGAAAVVPLGVAQAQTTGANPAPTARTDPNPSSISSVGEITVTARKRVESILKVPVTETVVTRDVLEKSGTHDLKDLTALAPNLVVASTDGYLGTEVTLRGVGTTVLNTSVDQAVSLSLDGLQVTNGIAYEPGLFDVGQVEVLAGPQALFYGKSSTGGVISLRSADPTNQTELMVRQGYEFEASEKTTEAVVSGPITDSLQVRLAGKFDSSDGFFRNLATATPGLGGVNPSTNSSTTDYLARLTVLWKPTDRFDARLKINYSNSFDDDTNGNVKITACPGGTSPLGSPIVFIDPALTCTANRDLYFVNLNPKDYAGVYNHGVPFTRYWQGYGTAELNYRLTDAVTLTSVTGYYEIQQSNLLDPVGTSAAGSPAVIQARFQRQDVSEEIRANSSFSGPLNFTIGAFYQHSHMYEPTDILSNTALGFPPYLQRGNFSVRGDTESGFGQLRYKVLSNVELSVGARIYHEVRTLDEFASVIGFVPMTPQFVQLADPRLSSTHVNPEVTLSYTPTDDLTLYGSYKEATKSGSFNTSSILPAGGKISFGDETAHGFEVGLKGRALDRNLRFTLAAFDYDYKGLQVAATELVNNLPVLTTTNAGAAENYGVELSGNYAVPQVRGLFLNAAVDWDRARFTEFSNAQCDNGQTIAEGCNQLLNSATGLYTAQNLTGRPLVRAPQWSLNFGFSYATEVGKDLRVTLNSNTQYSSNYYTDIVERPDTVQNEFFKTNLSATIGSDNGRWELALIGNNLANVITTSNSTSSTPRDGVFLAAPQITGGATSGAEGHDAISSSLDRGREVWLRLTFRN